MWKKFKYWFTEVFVYYYKWGVIIALALAGMITYLALDQHNQGKPDMYVAMVFSSYLGESDLEGIVKSLEDRIEDKNNDGKIIVKHTYLYLGPGTNEQDMMAFMALLLDGKYVMYLIDGYIIDNTDLLKSCSPYPIHEVLGREALSAVVDHNEVYVPMTQAHVAFRSNNTGRSDEDYYRPYLDLLARIAK